MNRARRDINALSVVTRSRMARVYQTCSFDDSVARRLYLDIYALVFQPCAPGYVGKTEWDQ